MFLFQRPVLYIEKKHPVQKEKQRQIPFFRHQAKATNEFQRFFARRVCIFNALARKGFHISQLQHDGLVPPQACPIIAPFGEDVAVSHNVDDLFQLTAFKLPLMGHVALKKQYYPASVCEDTVSTGRQG